MSLILEQRVVGGHVRRLRVELGLSLRALAVQTGFSASFISQVEHGQVSPSIGSMQKIAEALGVSLGEFFATAAPADGGLVVRAGERQALSSAWSRAEIETLSSGRPTARLQAMLVTLASGGRSGKHPHPYRHEEFAYVLRGSVVLQLGTQTYTLKRGDSVTIPPRQSRRWENQASRAACILVVALGPVKARRRS